MSDLVSGLQNRLERFDSATGLQAARKRGGYFYGRDYQGHNGSGVQVRLHHRCGDVDCTGGAERRYRSVDFGKEKRAGMVIGVPFESFPQMANNGSSDLGTSGDPGD